MFFLLIPILVVRYFFFKIISIILTLPMYKIEIAPFDELSVQLSID